MSIDDINYRSIQEGENTTNITALRLGDWEVVRTWCHCSICQSWEESPGANGEKAYGPVFVKHHCPLYSGIDELNRFEYKQMAAPCAWCGYAVPDEIQGVYVLMTGEMNVEA